MFNLLMQFQPWAEARDTILLDRMFEYTDNTLRERFSEDGSPAFAKLIEHPCLFMCEGTQDESARVGTITRARVTGKHIAFEYFLDPEVPPLPNSVIYANKADFDMPLDFEFSRMHWAVKEVDLYRLLLRLVRPRRQRPIVFAIEEHERIERELVSVMMPFAAEFNPVYEAIQQAAVEAGLRSRRADDIWEAPAIIQDLVNLIDRSRVVVCDCSGRNPNVFYEAGIAHTLGREVILLAQSSADIPFDLRHLRYIAYLNNAEGRRALTTALAARFRAILNRP